MFGQKLLKKVFSCLNSAKSPLNIKNKLWAILKIGQSKKHQFDKILTPISISIEYAEYWA
jgi:hypothetical protein